MTNGRPLVLPPDARLTLTTLGGASLVRALPGEPPTLIFGLGKPLALLAYLAFSPGNSASREHLLDLLWADMEPDAAKHALRQTLWFIRQRLGDGVVSSGGDTVRLEHVIESDRAEFLSAVDNGELYHAVAVYKGGFFGDFAAPGGAEFEKWADVERFRLRSLFARSAEELCRRWLTLGRTRDAQALARRVRDGDPLEERGWRLLLEALISGNDIIAAATEADRLEQLLVAEEIEPEPATRAVIRLARQLPASSPESPPHGSLVAELTGREHEFSTILAAWDQAKSGTARHIHLSAPAGLGKTRLLSDVRSRLRAIRARVVLVRANPGERQIPYSYIADLVGEVALLPGAKSVSPGCGSALVALNPTLSSHFKAAPDTSIGPEALRNRTHALVELVAAVADEVPLALLLDDVHWADEMSRQVVQSLVNRLSDKRVLVVTSARPVAEGRIEVQQTARVELAPLGAPQIAALVNSIGTLPASAWAEDLPQKLAESTDGSPLLVLESLQLAMERGLLLLADAKWTCPDPAALSEQLSSGSALRHRIEQLGRPQQWLVLLLAVAGTPVRHSILATAGNLGGGDTTPGAALETLEQRGFVCRTGDAWEPAHDEIAARALELSSPEAQRAAHAALGSALLDMPGDRSVFRLAALHLAAADDKARLSRVLRKYLDDARRRGDRRPPIDVAEELLGGAVAGLPAELVRALPLRTRIGDVTLGRIAAAAAFVLIGAAALAAAIRRPPAPPPDAVLLIARAVMGDTVEVREVPLRFDDWPRAGGIDLDGHKVRRVVAPHLTELNSVPSPNGVDWVSYQVVRDSGVMDLFLSREGTLPRRLTFAKGDDVGPNWSPDGQFLAFSTGRWDTLSRNDIAILDLDRGTVRQLDHGDTYSASPRWSPDGARIAYAHRRYDFQPHELCWITVDGAHSRCFSPRGWDVIAVEGWYDTDEVLAALDSAATTVFARVNLRTGVVRTLESSRGTRLVSPDGKWVACLCRRSEEQQPIWLLYPVDSPDLIKVLEVGKDSASSYMIHWRAVEPGRRFLNEIHIDTVAGNGIPIGVSYRLQARGTDERGRDMQVPLVQWRALDTVLAEIDSAGVLHPKRSGVIRVEASAGGWRYDTARVRIVPQSFEEVLEEDWTDGISSVWTPFGFPRPSVTRGPEGIAAFWNKGDGSFASGVYSTQGFDARGGLGVDAKFSTPFTMTQWQLARLVLSALSDSETLAAWDHKTGGWPANSLSTCGISYPSSEGHTGLAFLGTDAAGSLERWPVDTTLRSGRWYTVRIQIFPDGRCGFALNGKPIRIGSNRIQLDRPLHVVIDGNSAGTRILVGNVNVWQGVRTDIRW